MKRPIIISIIFFLLILTTVIFIKPIITSLVKIQLKKVFIGSQVYIGGCSIVPLKQLSFSDIKIKKQKFYDFQIKEVKLCYNLPSILQRNILKFDIKDVLVNINLGQKSFLALKLYFRLKSGGLFKLQDFELSNMNINLKSRDLEILGQVSAGLNLIKQSVNNLNAKINFIDSQGFRLENASVQFNKNLKPGNLSIAQIKYNKAKIDNINSELSFEDEALFLKTLTAQIFGGRVGGDFIFKLAKNMDYAVDLNFINLNLDKFVSDFNLEEKFQMTGSLGGKVSIRGSGLNINSITGDLSTLEAGGVLTITDKRFLENLARSSGQSLDILVESFKNYHYNIGIIKLGLDKGNLILDVSLDGEAGKRNLDIVVHDFKLRREER